MYRSLSTILSIVFVFQFIFISGLFAQQQSVKGYVFSSDRRPVGGATVAARPGKLTVVTGDDGSFQLPAGIVLPVKLHTTAIGYKAFDVSLVKPVAVLDTIFLEPAFVTDTVVITSRRRREALQEVPIPISVVGKNLIEDGGAFNIARVKEIVPSLQMYSSNPRNTGINIRGLGSPFGLTNDGLDPGVGFYIDGVYYARPAVATLDFIDVERVEVLRGPQGTLFGKNTTSGAVNIITRKPVFRPEGSAELSFGNFGFIQAKAAYSGPINSKLAARVSFSGTQRDGLIKNVRTNKQVNDMNNQGVRFQLLYQPTDKLTINAAGDFSKQRPDGYAQVVAGVVRTQRPQFRQFDAIITDLNYRLPSLNAFDRLIDHDTPWNSDNDLGRVSVTADLELGKGTLTSTTAWLYWNWGPSNDRDFTGLQSLARSQNPAKHTNWSQEVRYAGQISERLSGVAGLFYINQEVNVDGTEESGNAQWRFSQSSTSALWRTPGLLDGYGIRTRSTIKSVSAAFFANLDYKLFEGVYVLPGIRFNYDKKDVVYNRTTYGGLQTTDAALLALKNSVYSAQAYVADAEENNITYQLTVAYKPNNRINAFATYSTSFKPVGVNVAGLPSIAGRADTSLAVIKPEYVQHYEVGVKTALAEGLNLNVTLHQSDIDDYQTNVQSPQLGVNRGYIANAEKVRVRGAEIEFTYNKPKKFNTYISAAFTDGRYIKFTNAPLPLEETGKVINGQQIAFKDISGGRLPGISDVSISGGGDYTFKETLFWGLTGQPFAGVDVFYRSEFSSSPSPSAFLNIPGYALANARLGIKAKNGITLFAWVRNLWNQNYYEQLLPAGGNAGHYAAVLGDQRTFGITLRYAFAKAL